MWTDLSSAFGYGTKLTSTQQGQLRDNAIYCYDFIASGSLTNHGILLGSGTNPITPTAVMSNGQILIGQSAADPLPKTMSGDVTMGATGITAIGGSKVTNAMMANNAIGQAEMADNAIGQAELKDAMSSVHKGGAGSGNLTLPGGQFGFYPQIKDSGGGGSYYMELAHSGAPVGTNYVTNIHMYVVPTMTAYAQQRHITASGDLHWVFILRDKITKEIGSMCQSSEHPCFGNGGKPQLVPHPFPGYDKEKWELIVINPSMEEVEEILLKCEVDDETLPDKDFLEVFLEDYEIDELSKPAWPTKEVTVGLPKKIEVEIDGKKIMKPVDWRFKPPGTKVTPIKKIIPKPDYVICKSLKKKDK